MGHPSPRAAACIPERKMSPSGSIYLAGWPTVLIRRRVSLSYRTEIQIEVPGDRSKSGRLPIKLTLRDNKRLAKCAAELHYRLPDLLGTNLFWIDKVRSYALEALRWNGLAACVPLLNGRAVLLITGMLEPATIHADGFARIRLRPMTGMIDNSDDISGLFLPCTASYADQMQKPTSHIPATPDAATTASAYWGTGLHAARWLCSIAPCPSCWPASAWEGR